MARDGANRNALRSQRMLQEAFSKLIAEKPLDKISVSDVAREAGLNRGTFYAHYKSVKDLAGDILSGITDKLFEIVDEAASEAFLDDPLPTLNLAGENLKKDRELYRKLLQSSDADAFLAVMRQRVTARIAATPHACAHDGDDLMTRINIGFVVAGIIDVYRFWLLGEYGKASVEDVSRRVATIVQGAVIAH